MQGYRIMFKECKKAVLEKFSVSNPGLNEVQVKVCFSLISSGTEKAYLSGSENTENKFPTVPGYSSAGIIVKVGENVKEFKIGDRVFVAYGGHANYNVKVASSVVKIPDEISFEEAAFTRLASFPMLAIRRARLEMGESVAVVGLGMLGLFGVQIARLAGAVPLIGIGNREIRQEKAKKYGADLILSPNDPNLTEKIMEYTEKINGIKGANVIIETSGTESGLADSLKYTSKHARVMVNGCNRIMEKPINFYKYIHLRGVQLIGAHDLTRMPYNSAPGNWTAKRDYITILRYMADGRINAKDMISEIASPSDAAEIYNRLLNDREFPLGVLFDWENFKGE